MAFMAATNLMSRRLLDEFVLPATAVPNMERHCFTLVFPRSSSSALLQARVRKRIYCRYQRLHEEDNL
jgi:hypothetical protein